MDMGEHVIDSKTKKYLFKISGDAMANKRYYQAIRIFEKYKRTCEFSRDEEYRLAMLYDHVSIMGKARNKNSSRYLQKAEDIYRKLIAYHPNFLHGWYGLGRVYKIRGDYKNALRCQLKAYKLMLRQPRLERGALAIGLTFEAMGNYKKAEAWYKKELHDLSKNDFGATLNLFVFYKNRGDYAKASRLIKSLTLLIKKEYQKKIYRGLNMRKSNFLKWIQRAIQEVKNKVRSS